MATKQQSPVRVIRWSGGQHPSMQTITHILKREGLRPYMWMNMPNYRYGVRSHGYNKVVYVLDGAAEVTLPDMNKRVRLRSGDRIDIPAGVRHGLIVGSGGVKCLEATASQRAAAVGR